jgi:hypothetical protein
MVPYEENSVGILWIDEQKLNCNSLKSGKTVHIQECVLWYWRQTVEDWNKNEQ